MHTISASTKTMMGALVVIAVASLLGCSNCGDAARSRKQVILYTRALLHQLGTRVSLDHDQWRPGAKVDVLRRLRSKFSSVEYSSHVKTISAYVRGHLVMNPVADDWVSETDDTADKVCFAIVGVPRNPSFGIERFAVAVTYAGELVSLDENEGAVWIWESNPEYSIELPN